MKKALFVALAMTVGSAAFAAPFVWPAAWTAEQNTANKRGGEFRDYVISDFKTINPFTSAEADSIPQNDRGGRMAAGVDAVQQFGVVHLVAGPQGVEADGKVS